MQYIQILGFWSDIGKEIGHIALKILALPFIIIFLLLDGIVYTLVAYSYKLFELMSRMNFSTITMWLNPVISRIKALILVLVLFMVGYTLITYLINPDKASNGASTGVNLLKNIAITAILLAFYNTAFTLLNELTFVLIGAPVDYHYELLDDWFGVTNNGEQGLVTNLILGPSNENGDEEEIDFGRRLAISTLSIFLHGHRVTQYNRVETSKLAEIYSKAVNPKEEFNLLLLPGVALDINIIDNDRSDWGEDGAVGADTIDYQYPILSTIVGLYLVYTLITIAIEIGIRAFKLIILQILAPIAIITIIKDGWKSDKWQKYLKMLGSIYVNLFIRIGGMLFVTALITKAWTNISDLYDDNNISTGFTRYMLLILIVVAGYKMAKELPSFIDSVLGTKLSQNSGGFGSFLKDLTHGNWGIPGRVATGAAGLARGIRDGVQAGRAHNLNNPDNRLSRGAMAYNALRSGIAGARAGSRGQNIADNLRAANGVRQAARNRVQTMADRGGTLRSNIGFGIREATGRNYMGAARTNAAIRNENVTHQGAVDAETNRYQGEVNAEATRHEGAVNAETTRYEGAVNAENVRYQGAQATLDADIQGKITAANNQHQTVTANLNHQIQQHQQALQVAEQTMQSQVSSQFKNIDSGAGIQYGSSAETFARTAADNDVEYNQFKEAAEHFRMDAQSATSSADRAHAIEQANAAERAAASRHAEVITLATQEYETVHESAVVTERTQIEHLETRRTQSEEAHQRRIETIEAERESRQQTIDNDHATNMQTIENDHTTNTQTEEATNTRNTQQVENDHTTRTQQETGRHDTTAAEHQRLMERYTGRRNGGNNP